MLCCKENFNGTALGFRESQEKKESEPFKDAIVRSVVLVVCGGALIYILQQIGDKIPTG